MCTSTNDMYRYNLLNAHFVKKGIEGIRFIQDNVWRSTIEEIYSNLLGFIESKKKFSLLRKDTGLPYLFPKKLLDRVFPLITDMNIRGYGKINKALTNEYNSLK